ncbi:hypothetical protein H310_10945 [Aphanomyces invadans]|nr:hypothetical protein H310_10945 [Aphanomyces invadans]ETV95467.1 hypothetical protein H310_10945 [Aphanomyces invadans]|eukprot:XP_008875660.1 hypothetical protein H310_10945 [Aphanomyces invadans]
MDLVDANAEDFFASLNAGSAAAFLPQPVEEPMVKKPKVGMGAMATTAMKYDMSAQPKPSSVSILVPPPRVTVSTIQDPKEPQLPMEDRIANLLVPDMKVGDVIQLIKKMKQAGKSDADEFSELDAEMNSAPRFVCDVCGNTEQHNYITDYARGDTVCMGPDGKGCGNVVQDHIVHEGSAYRKFEGEEDKSHHGPAPNKLFSMGHNLRTMISQDGEQSANLRRASEFVEMNLSQMGKDERRTRIGYKDQMKQKACRLIDHTGANLDLHEIVCNRAKKMFAEFRDLREHVHQFEAVVAGCIIDAYMTTGKEMYQAQTSIKIGKFKQAGIAQLTLAPNKAVDEKKLHPFHCKACGLTFNAKRALQFHTCEGKATSDNGTNASTAAVELTPLEGPDDSAAPVRDVRDGKEWFQCPVCPRKYERREAAVEHMTRHKKQSEKRKLHIETATMDSTRFLKTNSLASANPSVQVNTHEQVLFRGQGRRPWLQSKLEQYQQQQELLQRRDDETKGD